MKVFWATRLRGFLRHLPGRLQNVEFAEKASYYESQSWIGKLRSMLIRSPLLDLLGVFQVIRIENKDCDCYGSFNRFLNADQPYFIYLETPTALYHYSLGRLRFPSGKRRFKCAVSNEHLRYVACMSNACRDTFVHLSEKLFRTVFRFAERNYKLLKLARQKRKKIYLLCIHK